MALVGWTSRWLTQVIAAKDKEIGWTREFDVKTLDECAATHVVAAFDQRLDGKCREDDCAVET